MAITTSIPSNLRKPMTSAEFDFTSAQRGLVPLAARVAHVGAMLNTPAWQATTAYTLGQFVVTGGNVYRCVVAGATSSTAPSHVTGTATDGTVTWLYVQPALKGVAATPRQMFTEKDADDYYGRGSEAALMARAGFKAIAKMKSGAEVWVSAAIDPGNVRQTKTFTVTVTTAKAGDVILKIAGRTVRAGVNAGDAQNTVASAIKDAIEKLWAAGQLGWTATVATNVVTITAVNGGVNGVDLKASVESLPGGVAVAYANGTAGTGAVSLTNALDAIRADKRYNALTIANHTSGDVTALKAHLDAVNGPATKKFCIAYLAEIGTLATATGLATGSNREDIVIVTAEDFLNSCGEIAAHVAHTVEGKSDPAYNYDGTELDLFLPAVASNPTDSEIESALANGATPLVFNDSQDQARICRWVTTRTTMNGAPFENLLDGSNIRSLHYSAIQVDTALRVASQGAKKLARTKKRVRSVVISTLRKMEEIEVLQNVEAHLGEVQVEDDAIVKTRLNVGVPNSVVPNLHQLAVVHTLYVE